MTNETKNRLDLPWKAGTGSEAVIYDSTGHRRIHEPDDQWEGRDFVDLNGSEDAAFIVKAVNNHDALVKMLDKIVHNSDPDYIANVLQKEARQLLNSIWI